MARSIGSVLDSLRPGLPILDPLAPNAADALAPRPSAVDRLIAGEYRRWIPLLGAWLAIAFSVGFGLFVNYRAQGRVVTFASAMMAMIPHYLVWALASPAIYRALHKTIDGVNRVFWLTMLLGWSVVASVGSTAASYLSYSIRRDLPLGLDGLIDIYFLPPAGPAFHAMNLSILALALGAFAAVRGLRLRDQALWEAARAQLRHAELETQLIEARLRALQAQINPHFLLNCLNSIAGLVRLEERERAFDAIGELGELLRTALIASNDRQGTLGDELAFVARYLKLCELRFESRVSWIISIPEVLRQQRVPALIVQPLLENAIKHGIEAERHMRIEIRGYVEGQNLVVEVSDDGRGLDPGVAAAPPDGRGLSNIAERMRLYYGGRGSLKIEPRLPRGTSVRLSFPM